MEQSQSRLMIGLAVVLAAITVGLWVGDPKEKAPADPDATEQVWSLAADDVVRVEIHRSGAPAKADPSAPAAAASGESTVVLEKSDGKWRVIAPETFDADPDQVHGILRDLADIDKGVPIEGGEPANFADFGLGDPPVARVVVGMADGSQKALSLGKAAPVGWRTYALAPSGKVVAVDGHPGEKLAAPVANLRDRRVFTFSPADVRRITLTGPDGTLSVHGEGKRWWLDGFTRADANAVDDLVSGLLTLRFDAINDGPVSIDQPIRTATVETTAGSAAIRVGPADGSDNLVAVEGGLAGPVLTDSLALLGEGPTDLGDSRAFPFDPEATDAISIVHGETTWKTEHDGSAWKVGGTESPDAAEVAREVSDAAIHYRKEPVPPISQPWLSVVVHVDGADRRVDLGQLEGTDFRVAKDADGGEPYLVPVTDLAEIAKVAGVGGQ